MIIFSILNYELMNFKCKDSKFGPTKGKQTITCLSNDKNNVSYAVLGKLM